METGGLTRAIFSRVPAPLRDKSPTGFTGKGIVFVPAAGSGLSAGGVGRTPVVKSVAICP
ncbi:MAG TPA: hypothetical protein VMV04_19125 [Thermodesulfobacteriota bacterium]|nr:hypothetical protein [Thermodesulfobacteriota bacterium]